MDIYKLLSEKEKERDRQNYIQFSSEELLKLKDDQAKHLIDVFHGHTLMRLPQEEIDFFEWLKIMDLPVWEDLWADSDDTLYLISIDLLKQFTGDHGAFPICDLINEPNYWFSSRHIKPKGNKELETILNKTENGQRLTASELFLYELISRPTDIWHFCYCHKIALNAMKSVIDDMVFKGWLVHLPDRADLVKYIDI